MTFNHQIGKRFGTTEQRHPGGFLFFAQRECLGFAVVHRALQYLAFACAASAVAATIGQRKAMFQRRFKDGLILVNGKGVFARQNGGFEAHGSIRLNKGRDFNA